MNTTELLDIATAICPDRSFLTFEGKTQTFIQTKNRINSLAVGLKQLGIRKGDRVGMLNVNCPQSVESYFAVAKLGAIYVPLNFRVKAEELAYMVDNAGIRALFVGGRYIKLVENLLRSSNNLELCIAADEMHDGWSHYEDLIDPTVTDEPMVEIKDDDMTILMYTSGTTARPKGVPLTHQGFVSYVLENIEPASPEIEERNLLSVPLYHVAGIQAMIAATYGGRTLVLMRQFEVNEWLKTVHEQRISRTMLVPTMLKRVIDAPDFHSYDLSCLKVISYGAAPMPFEVIKKAIKTMPWVYFINAFGQTETASTITVLGPEDHKIEGTEELQAKKLKRLARSIGRPLPDIEIKIVDDKENELSPFNVGELFAKGSRVMSGYWNDAEKTAKTITDDGWLRTGDRGWMDEDGYIYLSGRADDMIIRGGENISPEEVEEVIRSNVSVYDCAVIGVEDAEWGQEIKAVVERKEGHNVNKKELLEYCRGKLAGFKRPRSVIFVDELPRNSMGKILKNELRERYGKEA